MVINSDSDDSTTAKQNDDQKPRNRYRPQFLEHFDRKNTGDARGDEKSTATEYFTPAAEQQQQQQQQHQEEQHLASGANDLNNWEHNMEMQFQQISAINQYGLQQHQQQQQVLMAYPLMNEQLIALNNQQNLLLSNAAPMGQQGIPAAAAAPAQPPPAYQNQHMHTQSHAYVEGEFEFLKFLTFDDLNAAQEDAHGGRDRHRSVGHAEGTGLSASAAQDPPRHQSGQHPAQYRGLCQVGRLRSRRPAHGHNGQEEHSHRYSLLDGTRGDRGDWLRLCG